LQPTLRLGHYNPHLMPQNLRLQSHPSNGHPARQ
jgi:hypothetical protein